MADDDDVIGKFGEDTCNARSSPLCMKCNCNVSHVVSKPEWTGVRSTFLMDEQLMAVSGNVRVDSTDIGCSDHFLV